MEERQDNTKNIKLLGQILKDNKLDSLIENIKQSKAKATNVVKKLSDKEATLIANRKKADKVANQNLIDENNSEITDVLADNTVNKEDLSINQEKIEDNKEKSKGAKTKKSKTAQVSVETNEKVESVVQAKGGNDELVSQPVENQPNTSKQESKKDNDVAVKVELKAEEQPKTQPKAQDSVDKEKQPNKEVASQQKVEVKTDSKQEVNAQPKAEVGNEKPNDQKQEVKATQAQQPQPTAEQPQRRSILSFIVKKADQIANEKPANQGFKRERGERPDRNGQDRNQGFKRNGERQFNGDRQFNGERRNGNNGERPNFNKPQGQVKFGDKRGVNPSIKPTELSFVPAKDSRAQTKKKVEKNYEEKHVATKKSLKHTVTIEDFDENKTGYRKVRKPKVQKKEEQSNFIKIEKAVLTKEITPIKELSEKFGISAVEITKRLFKEGIIKTINDSIDFDTASFIAADLGIEIEQKFEKSAEEVMNEAFDSVDQDENLVKRSPVVTVMGHVDHGKTSLLDRIRSANVADGEAGGITQHIGAYSVDFKGNKITFIDTPGHAAFTSMRARGAQITDIAIIVVAADDGVMPQTIEAINHAKAANVSIIVAANKMDKPHVDVDRLRTQLSEQELLVEEWGGDIMLVPVSAKTGDGIDKLMEAILLTAEMSELTANPNRKAKGTVIEAKLDKGKGPVATILVQNGTLHTGDNIVAGTVVGRVRAMINDRGNIVKEAGPSVAVSVLGLEEVPNAGDALFAVDEEKLSKLVAEERKNKEREDMIRQQSKVTLDDLFSKISEGELKNLNIIIKADVQGSAEAVKQSLSELSNEEVKVNILHAAVGAINETDVMLADSSNSIIIGFNVRPDAKAKVVAERSHVDIKLYRIIYEAIEDIQKAMKGMLAPKFKDIYTGKAEVRNTFKISNVGMVAGCYVTDGKIVRQAKLRIYRDDVMICEGNVMQLKRFKDDVKEVQQGFECGISIEGFNDIKVGDFIESYIVEQSK